MPSAAYAFWDAGTFGYDYIMTKIFEVNSNWLHWQKFTGNNHGDQEVNFGPQNSLNLIHAHLQFKKFSGGYTPGPPLKGEGKGRGEGGAGREGQGNRGEREGKEGYGQEGRERGGEGKACIGPPPFFKS
jgi:hypothetical protein